MIVVDKELMTDSRYVSYATANGRTPEDQFAHDARRWTRAKGVFVVWLDCRWKDFCHATGIDPASVNDPDAMTAFDDWLLDYALNRKIIT